nr:MAG TPA: hypothetical protein [Bacteriophage sp.]
MNTPRFAPVLSRCHARLARATHAHVLADRSRKARFVGKIRTL